MTQLKENPGLIIQDDKYKVVKKLGKKGDHVEKHNHPEANVLFTVVKGQMRVTVQDEHFNVVPGQMLTFDGNDDIQAEFLEDSEFFVTLIHK